MALVISKLYLWTKHVGPNVKGGKCCPETSVVTCKLQLAEKYEPLGLTFRGYSSPLWERRVTV